MQARVLRAGGVLCADLRRAVMADAACVVETGVLLLRDAPIATRGDIFAGLFRICADLPPYTREVARESLYRVEMELREDFRAEMLCGVLERAIVEVEREVGPVWCQKWLDRLPTAWSPQESDGENIVSTINKTSKTSKRSRRKTTKKRSRSEDEVENASLDEAPRKRKRAARRRTRSGAGRG